jgi:hypothetical protein
MTSDSSNPNISLAFQNSLDFTNAISKMHHRKPPPPSVLGAEYDMSHQTPR